MTTNKHSTHTGHGPFSVDVIFCGFIQSKSSEEEDEISIIHGLLLVSFDFVSLFFFLAVGCLQVEKHRPAHSGHFSSRF
jgi:hypothetical protein